VSDATLHCERCASAIEADDLRCPVCNLTCPTCLADDRPGVAVDILRCSSCGAAMTYDVDRRAAACASCGSVLEVEHPADPIEEPDVLLPFSVNRAAAEAALSGWLGTLGWFRPGDLRSGARVETMQALRWVGWVFDAAAEVSWTADTDHDARRADWAPHAGRVELDFDDVVVPATRGLRPAEVGFLIPSYDTGTTSAPDGVVDATVEHFDLPRSAARARLVEAVEGLARQRLAQGHLPGSRFRNLRTATVLRGLEAQRVAFPVWVLAYRYRDRLYRAVISGQNAGRLHGEAPYSVARIAAALTAAVAVAGLLVLLAL
jgi:hypothetical protein